MDEIIPHLLINITIKQYPTYNDGLPFIVPLVKLGIIVATYLG
jgi:hypothetical protein